MGDLSSAAASPGRLKSWRHALSTVNPPEGQPDSITRWLVISRAGVLPMTLAAGAVAGLLAVRQHGFAAGWFALAFVGIVLAHVSNNLLNDLFDTETGLDTCDYPRALYAPHPILSGMISRAGLVRAAVVVNATGIAVLAVLMGKHIDKLPWDETAGVRTLPVMLGERRARIVTDALMIGFYAVLVACVLVDALPWPVLVAFAALPLLVRALKALGRPRPERPPRGFPVWPLWFAAFAFTHTRRAGALLVIGLAVAAIFDVKPLGLT